MLHDGGPGRIREAWRPFNEIMGVPHDSLWRIMMHSIRDSAHFFVALVSPQECPGFVQRTFTLAAYLLGEYLLRWALLRDGVPQLLHCCETDVERIVALRTHFLQIEFHQLNVAVGIRVQWDMPKSAPLFSVEAFVREAKLMDGAQPPRCTRTTASPRTPSVSAPTTPSCCCGAHQ